VQARRPLDGTLQGQILDWPMQQENVEVVRRSFAELDRSGIDSALGYFDPEIEWTTTDAYIESATYRGHEGVRLYFDTIAAEFDDLCIEAEELIAVGDQVVASVRLSGQGKVSGAPVELRLTGVSWLRDGKIVGIRNYQDKVQALEALEARD
jgi:ketosteroid isomerase-like protein